MRALGLLVLVVVTSVTLGRVVAGHPRAPRSPSASSEGLARAPGPTPTTVPAALSVDLPPAEVASLPQTAVKPSAGTPVFRSEMALLWAAVQRNDPSLARRAFFPERAYLRLKALPDDAADWHHRLWANFVRDVAAAHRLLGAGASRARLVTTLVPSWQAGWIVPGTCFNRLPYWHLPGSRMVYTEAGQERSFGIASMISWRGVWYVVHFGAVYPPPGQGVVDAPAIGPGSFGPPGGC